MDLIRTVTPARHRHQRGPGRLRRPVARHRARGAVGHAGGGRAPVGRPPRSRDATSASAASGKVGAALADHLHAEGCRLSVADVRAAAAAAVAERTGAAVVAAGPAHAVPCDVFSPCALGAVLSATTIPELGVRGGGRIGQQPARHAAGCPADPRRRCAVRAGLRRQRRRSDQHRPGDGVATIGRVPTSASGGSTTPSSGCSTSPTRRASPPRRPPTSSRSAGSRRPRRAAGD